MTKTQILPAWGRILRGYRPLLSIEITKECPLRCPGCYAYEPGHLGGSTTLHQLSDYRGDDLVEGVLALVRRHRPLHLSIVGGEPLVRFRELDLLLPKLDRMNVEVQLVTSAVRPLPQQWAGLKSLHVVLSVDGLPEEHDRRRAPATYDRILRHIGGHKLIVHCTITRSQLRSSGYLRDFARFWSERPEARKIWFSLYTPQEGDDSEERLTADDRARAIERLAPLPASFPKVHLPRVVLDGYVHPPASPDECIFAQTAVCVSADLKTPVAPCQFGGNPVCGECGCMASAGLASIGRYKIAGVVPVSSIFFLSARIGKSVQRLSGEHG
ncbi:MAG: radical SAM protein [Acidobacteriia bacterium]|nr:radical SAM protein [Terriglobia bacterium]